MNFYIFNNGLLVEKGVSGSDQRVYNWSQIFANKNHQITLIIPKVGVERFKKFNFKLLITTDSLPKHGDFFAYLWQTYMGVNKVLKLGKIGKDGVIYSSSDLIADSIPALILKIRNINNKMICGLHLIAPNPFRGFTKVWQNSFSFPKLQGIYYYETQKLIIFFLKHFANLVLVSNSLDREFLIKKGFKEGHVLVTFGGVDFKEIPQKKFPKKFDAVWVGRLHVQKGIDDLFLAWKEVIKTYPKAKLAVVGEPDIEAYFKKKEYFPNLSKNVVFTGYLEGEKIYEILKSSKISLCPSYYESFGMVIAEALAAGLPVVAYNLPVYKKIYNGGMVLAPIGNVNEFSLRIKELLSSQRKRTKLAIAAQKIGHQFTWEKTADKILKLI